MSSFGRGRRAAGEAGGTRSRAPEVDLDPAERAREICLQQLSFAPRTRAELGVTLAKRDIPDEVAEEVLSRFTEVGLIDDALFSQMWVTSRHRGRGLASRALQHELRRKGVDDDVAREALDELDPAQERATARALVDRKLPSTRGLAADVRVRRLAGMLARKGYSSGVAFSVVREALADEGLEITLDTDGLSALD